jgi:hypothetical protein
MRRNSLSGEPHSVRFFSDPPAFVQERPRRRGARARGIAYERKVQKFLCETRFNYLPSVWISWIDDESRVKWAQPDGLLIDPWKQRLWILEVKYQHTETAWKQMELYRRLLESTLQGVYDIRTCEIVKWYDPATVTPVTIRMCREVEDASRSLFNVHILNP